jgi:hypothetical protein
MAGKPAAGRIPPAIGFRGGRLTTGQSDIILKTVITFAWMDRTGLSPSPGQGRARIRGAIVPNDPNDNRREPRFETRNAITFSCLNKDAHYIGIAHNISRSGMFFRSGRKLKPGTCIVILPLDCRATDLLWGDGDHGMMAASLCAIEGGPNQNLKHFINMVTGKVTRCENLESGDQSAYGIAVDYIRPTV